MERHHRAVEFAAPLLDLMRKAGAALSAIRLPKHHNRGRDPWKGWYGSKPATYHRPIEDPQIYERKAVVRAMRWLRANPGALEIDAPAHIRAKVSLMHKGIMKGTLPT